MKLKIIHLDLKHNNEYILHDVKDVVAVKFPPDKGEAFLICRTG